MGVQVYACVCVCVCDSLVTAHGGYEGPPGMMLSLCHEEDDAGLVSHRTVGVLGEVQHSLSQAGVRSSAYEWAGGKTIQAIAIRAVTFH